MNPGVHAQPRQAQWQPISDDKMCSHCYVEDGWCSTATVTRSFFRQEAEITVVTLGEQLATPTAPSPAT